MTETTQTASEEKIEFVRPKFYRDKRFFRSFLISFAVLCYTGSLFTAFVVHTASAIVWDWWFFSYWKVRESDTVSEAYLAFKEMTRGQVDAFSNFFIMVKIVAFTWACSFALAAYLYKMEIGYETVFILTYLGINFIAGCYSDLWKKMPYPYLNFFNFGNGNIDFQNRPMTDSSNSPRWDDRSSLTTVSNPIGYTNPCSPNYTGISLFNK